VYVRRFVSVAGLYFVVVVVIRAFFVLSVPPTQHVAAPLAWKRANAGAFILP
jgi:hypothetical protein